MRIGVVSDTHSREIPHQLADVFSKVDLIVHAGDICSVEDLEFFSRIKEVVAVCGNMDDENLCCKLPKRRIFQVGKISIGLCHGRGPAKRVVDYVKEEFKEDKVDVVIFGHSHRAFNEKIGDVLYFNPGSLTDKISAPCCSYGILEIGENNNITGKIIKIED